VFLAVM